MKLHAATLALLGLVVAVGASGCATRMLATRIAKAPNQQGSSRDSKDPKMRQLLAATETMYAEAWRVSVGPPAAELAVAVLDPGDFKLVLDVKEKLHGDGHGSISMNFKWHVPSPEEKARAVKRPVKGTLVLLHGIMMNKESGLPWALYFAEKGYRVVLVDLRGHGRSTGDWIGYGAWEAADLAKVTDDLQRRGLIEGRLGVFGISYGAVMALHWAARDPRVATVAALAPFSDPQQAIEEFARGFSPKLAANFNHATFAAAAERAAATAGFRWSEVSVLGAVKRLHVPVLFFHGQRDNWIPPPHTERLAQAAPPGSRRVVLPNDDHFSIAIRFDKIGPEALAWFDAKLQPGTERTPPVATATPVVN